MIFHQISFQCVVTGHARILGTRAKTLGPYDNRKHGTYKQSIDSHSISEQIDIVHCGGKKPR